MMFAAECSDFGDACVPVTEWSWEFPFALACAVFAVWLVMRDRRRWPDQD